tara:strand:- start:430 stop:2331 length:1902 start_codon:yes stop_codon:yes gene_type:complete
MGLMDFLEKSAVPFATGVLEGLSDKAKAQNEQDAYEDQLKLQNVYSAQAYSKQKQTDFEFLEKENKIERDKVTEILDAEGMSKELQTLLSPYTKNFETYSGFLENNNYTSPGWFKEFVPFIETNAKGDNVYEGVTFENFILSQNKLVDKTKQQTKIETDLTSSGSAFEGQSNTLKALTGSSMAEEAVGTATTVDSPFPASFDTETTEQLNAAQIQKTGEIEQEDLETGFTGAAIPFTQFNLKQVAEVSNTERTTRDRAIGSALAVSGGFEGKIITNENGQLDTSKLIGFDLIRWNTLINFSTEIARDAEENNAVFLTPNEITQGALAKEKEISQSVTDHLTGILNPIHNLAVKSGLVTDEEANLYNIYEDVTNMTTTELNYYRQVAYNNMGDEGKGLLDLLNSKEFVKPAGFDDIANKIDDAVIGSLNVENEGVYNDDGDLILTNEDLDAPLFDKDSAGAALETDLFGESTPDPDKKKIITPKITEGVTTYDLSKIDISKITIPSISQVSKQNAMKTATADSITVKDENDEDIILTLGSRIKIGSYVFEVSDAAIKGGMSSSLNFNQLSKTEVRENPKEKLLKEIKKKIKFLNKQEKIALSPRNSEDGRQMVNDLTATLKTEIEELIKELQGE